MKKKSTLTASLLSFLTLSILPVGGQVVRDDFNDGDDAGWTRLDPISEHPAVPFSTATFSFPGGDTYRVQAAASPDPGLGQARAGSLHGGTSYTAFRISVDIVDWDNNLEQDIGLLARVSDVGLGTTDGYSATIDVDESTAYVARIDDEAPTVIGSGAFSMDPAKDYRLVFHGYEDTFYLEVFELPDVVNPVTVVFAFDTMYTSGEGAVFGSAGTPTGTADVTFDNYESTADADTDGDLMIDAEEVAVFGDIFEEGELDFDSDGWTNAQELLTGSDPKDADSFFQLAGCEVGASETTLEFPIVAGRIYEVEKSNDLTNWVVDGTAVFTDPGGGLGRLVSTNGGGAEFVRVKVTR